MKRTSLIVSLVLLSGCQPDVTDLQAYVQQVSQTTQVAIEPYPEFASMEPFDYQGEAFRDPFVRPKNQAFETVTQVQPNCVQPDFQRAKQPLERFGIDAMAYKGSFSSNGKRYGLVQTNTGQLYQVTAGDHIGLFYGKVSRIDHDAIVITEMLPDGTGCWQRKEAKLGKAAVAGEQDNV